MNLKEARKMLAAASLERECDDVIRRQGCSSCDEWWPVAIPAQGELQRLGFTPVAFAALILAVEALEQGPCWFVGAHDIPRFYATDEEAVIQWRCNWEGEPSRSNCQRCKALAAWEKL